MSENFDPLSLEDVKNRFLESEAALTDLATSMEDLGAVSEQLDRARTEIGEAAATLGKLAADLSGLTDALQLATKTIIDSDPNVVLTEIKRLRDLSTSMEAVVSNQGASITKLKEDQAIATRGIQQVAKSVDAVGSVTSMVRVLVFVATAASVLGLAVALFTALR